MARIALIDPAQASGRCAEIFRDIEAAFGRVPNLFRASAHHLALLEANWRKVESILLDGVLSRKTKETMAVLISRDNACDYCVAAHEGALRALGMGEEQICVLQQDLEEAGFSPKERALIELARKANRNPHVLSDEDFQKLQQTGANEVEIVEALGVMEIFSGFNKFLDSLQVEIDP